MALTTEEETDWFNSDDKPTTSYEQFMAELDNPKTPTQKWIGVYPNLEKNKLKQWIAKTRNEDGQRVCYFLKITV